MSDDVLITPASRKIEFKDNSGNVDGKIELDSSGNLKITSPGGGLELGDAASDIYVGNGSANIDIIFEQNGEIRGTTGRTVTLGQNDSNITVDALNFNTSTSTLFKSQNGITSSRIVTDTNADGGATNISSFTAPHTLVGINESNTNYALLATLPATTTGTLDHINIEGSMGGWTHNQNYRIKFKRRDSFGYEFTIFSARSAELSRAGIVAYQASNGTVTVHAKLTAGQYGKVTYTITDSYQAIIVDNPSLTTSTPAGTLVFDSTNVSSYPPSMKFPDNQKLEFGAASALQIYHQNDSNGTNSHIADLGTGDLTLSGSNYIIFKSAPAGEYYAIFRNNSSCDLYYNNVKKFETISTGAKITGDLETTADIELGHPSDTTIARSSAGVVTIEGNTIITTGNSDTPSTTTSSSDADFVLIDDGGTMKKITPSNLGIGGGGGGASNLNGLSDVTISSVQNNDLLKYNSTASRWENTNLGLTVTPTLSLNGGVYYNDQTAMTLTVTNHSSYDLPAYSVEVRRADNNNLIFNMDSGPVGGVMAISLGQDQAPIDGRPDGQITINTSQSASNFDTVSTDNFKVLVIAQDFGDLQSEVATLNVSVAARPQVAFTTSTYRYWRITDMGERLYITNWRAFSAINQGGTEYPGTLASTSTPSNNFSNSWSSDGQTNVAYSNFAFSDSYTAIDMFDDSVDSSGWWGISPSTASYWSPDPGSGNRTHANQAVSWDMGTARQIKSMEFKFNDQFTNTVGSNDNSFIIQGSSDNTNWTTVCTVTDSDQDFSAATGTATVKVSDSS